VLSAVLAGAVLLLLQCRIASCCCRPEGARMARTFQRHPNPGVVVTAGVDTHADIHVATAVDSLGRLLGSLAIPTTVEGYAELLAWAGYGQVGCFGVEGTGSWGAGLTRWLAAGGQAVVEVPRADRARRRGKGKSDTLDAEAAARAALAGLDVVVPKRQDGPVEMIRALRVARRSAMKARIQAGLAPDLLALPGVGTETAAALLEPAGDNPGRLVSEAAFAHLCGAAPLPASSGKTTRHRFQPRWPPRGQRGAVAHRAGADEVPRAYPRLCRQAHRRRAVQARDHALLEALRGPRGLPLPQAHRPSPRMSPLTSGVPPS
jgi:hypothetical protein